MLVDTIQTGEQLRAKFKEWGRYNQFSIYGYDALVDYFSEFDENIELDIIGICCDFSEYTADELINDYGEQNETADETAERLRDVTWIIELDNGNYLLQNF